ncbi:collagen alpha-6(VI) chain-like [Rhopilema esculentum]|uniref:collagen alpha-6(VI) chain-like n=1 Tax=Rhopilema esculentum TaxID=499914 RepID=UPI0031DD4234
MYITLLLSIGSVLFLQTHSQECIQRQDVVMVYELAYNTPNQFENVEKALQELIWSLKLKNHDCIRLGVILVWKKVDTLIPLSCTYGDAPCFNTALNIIKEQAKQQASSGKLNVSYDKSNLAAAIETAYKMLSSQSSGARFSVGNSVILVLNNGPGKDNLPTEDAVKHLHDYGITLYVVAMGDGKKEYLNDIVLEKNSAFPVKDGGSAMPALKTISKLINGTYRFAEETFDPDTGEIATSLRVEFSPLSVNAESLRLILAADEKSNICREAVDIGFLIDSSKSIKQYYSKEKFFVQRVASAAGFNQGSRAGVVLFSSASYVKMLVPFTNNIVQFRNDVEKMPLYGYQTRIDKALKVAGEDLFAAKNGDRPNVKDILILVTDGKQLPAAGNYDVGNEIVVEPEVEARRLRSRNITIYAIGVGGAVNKTQLELITGSPNQVYMLKRFDELVTDEFVKNLTEFACKGGQLKTATPKVITFTDKARTSPATTPATTLATTQATTQAATLATTPATSATTKGKNDCKCKDCRDCGCTDDCGCSRGCGEKPAVYLNIFNGANSNNMVVQSSEVSQTGPKNSLNEYGQERNIHPKLMAGTSLKNKTVEEIRELLKTWLPYQSKVNEAVAELIRRNIQKRRKRSV